MRFLIFSAVLSSLFSARTFEVSTSLGLALQKTENKIIGGTSFDSTFFFHGLFNIIDLEFSLTRFSSKNNNIVGYVVDGEDPSIYTSISITDSKDKLLESIIGSMQNIGLKKINEDEPNKYSVIPIGIGKGIRMYRISSMITGLSNYICLGKEIFLFSRLESISKSMSINTLIDKEKIMASLRSLSFSAGSFGLGVAISKKIYKEKINLDAEAHFCFAPIASYRIFGDIFIPIKEYSRLVCTEVYCPVNYFCNGVLKFRILTQIGANLYIGIISSVSVFFGDVEDIIDSKSLKLGEVLTWFKQPNISASICLTNYFR